jgi:rubredoxin
MRLSTSTYKLCPWCGRGLWQYTESPDTPESHTTAKCHHCGYRYKARLDPTGQIVEKVTPGTVDEQLPDADIDTLGRPDEMSPEYLAWVQQQINDVLNDDMNNAIEDDWQDEMYD